MKIKNKKTGEICELVGFNISNASFKGKFGEKDYYTLQEYKQAVEDAKRNLEGEELEKCITALNNYMKNMGDRDIVLDGGLYGRSEK